MWDRPPRREAQGDGATVVLRGRESRLQGEGWQVLGDLGREVREMRNAETVLGIIRERGRRGLPLEDNLCSRTSQHWRAGYSERRTPGVRREARCRQPVADRGNLEESFRVTALT